MTSTMHRDTPRGRPSAGSPNRDAQISRGPRCDVRRDLTSIILVPAAIRDAQGCRTESAFMVLAPMGYCSIPRTGRPVKLDGCSESPETSFDGSGAVAPIDAPRTAQNV